MSLSLACPACGAAVTFKSSASVFVVCPFCSSMLVRRDMDLEALGKMASLQEDMSPLQVGVRGRWDEKGFELIGRLRISWADGAWNEWYARFDDGREGWLAEAQGTYAMNFAVVVPSLPALGAVKVGAWVPLEKNRKYEVTDIKVAECVGSEGELPFRAPKGRRATSVDLTTDDGHFGCIEYAEGEGARAYIGRYAELDAMRLTGLRQVDGW